LSDTPIRISRHDPEGIAADEKIASGLWWDFFRRLYRNRLAISGLTIVCIMVFVAVFAPHLAPFDPLDMDIRHRLQSPNHTHWLGSDTYGRDLLSRVIFGARLSLEVGLMVVVLTTIFGTLFGLLSGYFPRLDHIIMRIMDALMAFPAILLAIAIMAALGPSEINVVLALSVVYTPRTTRVVRGSVLSTKENDYVKSARAAGANDIRILMFHILPNCLSPLIVQSTFIFAHAILAEAGLSFVGAGPPPPTPSWGNVLSEGREYMRTAPWITVFPGLAIAFSVLGLNLAGDGLRDVLDPRLKR
jgi:peptide/nickel transport system permease protein